MTSLIMACQEGRMEVVTALLEKRAELDARAGDGGTALMVACQQGLRAVVKALLDRGADANLRRNDGVTALMPQRGAISKWRERCSIVGPTSIPRQAQA